MMTIEFLGTGTSMGVPVIACDCEVCSSTESLDKRLRSSVMIDVCDQRLLIDAGPDFRQQMLRANVKHIDAILLTHGHTDHVAGLDDVRAINWQMQQPMPVYGESFVNEEIKLRFGYAFAEHKYPGVPEYQLNDITLEPFHISNITITPIRVWHHRLPVVGFRINQFAYITDANRIDKEELDKLKNLDILVINGLRPEKHLSHFSLDEAIEVIQQIKPKQAYITHISHQMGLHQQVNSELPENIQLAYDTLRLTIN